MASMTAFAMWRKRLSLTQRKAAELLDVTLPTYQSWEKEARLSDGRHLSPPRTALLAAAAIEAGVDPLPVDTPAQKI